MKDFEKTIEVAIATTSSRLAGINLAGFPAGKTHKYVIYCQAHADDNFLISEFRQSNKREDVELFVTTGRGAARNRNAALARTRAEVLLFTDDDVDIDQEGLSQLAHLFQEHQDMSLIVGMARNQHGLARKRYFDKITRLNTVNTARIGTIELAVRPDHIRSANVQFDTNFGAGAIFPIGDEYIFATDALKAGLRGIHAPVFLATHADDSSGTVWDEESGYYRGKVFNRVFGKWSILYKMLFFAKNINKIPMRYRAVFAWKLMFG